MNMTLRDKSPLVVNKEWMLELSNIGTNKSFRGGAFNVYLQLSKADSTEDIKRLQAI